MIAFSRLVETYFLNEFLIVAIFSPIFSDKSFIPADGIRIFVSKNSIILFTAYFPAGGKLY